jgi:hypothetical protein
LRQKPGNPVAAKYRDNVAPHFPEGPLKRPVGKKESFFGRMTFLALASYLKIRDSLVKKRKNSPISCNGLIITEKKGIFKGFSKF